MTEAEKSEKESAEQYARYKKITGEHNPQPPGRAERLTTYMATRDAFYSKALEATTQLAKMWVEMYQSLGVTGFHFELDYADIDYETSDTWFKEEAYPYLNNLVIEINEDDDYMLCLSGSQNGLYTSSADGAGLQIGKQCWLVAHPPAPEATVEPTYREAAQSLIDLLWWVLHRNGPAFFHYLFNAFGRPIFDGECFSMILEQKTEEYHQERIDLYRLDDYDFCSNYPYYTPLKDGTDKLYAKLKLGPNC